jgi:flagellar motility protein MotE (MotC chaperone)
MRGLRTIVVVSVLAKLVGLAIWVVSAGGPAEAASTQTAATPGATAAAAAGDAGLPSELLAKTRGFRDLLESVRARAAALDQRERDLAAREVTLRGLEKTIAGELTKLETPGKAPGATQAAATADAGGQGVAITKVYETMKAEEAAPILDKLDDATLRSVLGRMKERQIGAILAAMNRDRAVAFTKELVGVTPAPALPAGPPASAPPPASGPAPAGR